MNPRTKTRYTGVLAMLAAVAAIGATVTVPVPADAATPNGAPSATTINGVAWDDVDADGVNDAVEPGLAGVTVKLYNAANALVQTITTTSNGLYAFNGLNPAQGPFVVDVTTPTLYTITTGAGGDSDVTRSGLANHGVSAPVMPGNSIDAGVRPQWTLDLGVWGGGPLSGSGPFQTDPASVCPGAAAPGDDCDASDTVVRSQDAVNFLWSVSAANPEAALFAPLGDVVLEQTIVPAPGAHITPGNVPVACTTAGGGGTAPPTSRATLNADGSITLICNLGVWNTSGTAKLLQFDVNVTASNDGSTFTSSAVAYSTATEVTGGNATTSPTTVKNGVPSAPMEDEFTVSATFKYDVNKGPLSTQATVYYDPDGAGPTPTLRGRTFFWQFGISSPVTGNEPIAQPITFVEDMFTATGTTSTPFSGGDIEHYLYNCQQNVNSSAFVPLGYNNGDARSVVSSGTCALSRTGGNSSPYTVTLSGINDSMSTVPTKYANLTGDLSNGPFFIAAYQAQVFVPDRAIDLLDGNPTNSIGTGWLWNRIADFEPVSTSGAENYGGTGEPGLCDSTADPYASNPIVPGCSPMPGTGAASNNLANQPISIAPPGFGFSATKQYRSYVAGEAWNATGNQSLPYVPGMFNAHDGLGIQEPGQNLQNFIQWSFGGEVAANNMSVCDVFDNTMQKLVPATTLFPTAPAGTYGWVRQNSGFTAAVAGSQPADWVVEYGVFPISGDDPEGTGVLSPLTGRFPGVWTSQKAAANACGTTTPTGGWQTDPTLVPGGVNAVNAVRVRQADMSAPYGVTFGTSAVVMNFFFPLQARSTYNGGPHDGQGIKSGTVAANFRLARYTRVDTNVTYNVASTYVAEPESAATDGDRVTFSNGYFLISKNTVTIGGVGSGAANVNATGVAVAGQTLVYHITPSVNSVINGANTVTGIKVVDVMPKYTSYDATCTANLAGGVGTPADIVEPNTPTAGQTRLTWFYPPAVTGQPMKQLYFCAGTDPLAPVATNTNNVATVSGIEIPSPASDPHVVTLTQIGQINVGKYVDSPLDVLNDTQVWSLQAMNLSNLVPMKSMTFIEVFPYNGDSTNPAGVNRNPGSDFHGTLKLTAVPVATYPADPAAVKPTAPGTTYYTADPPASIDQNINTNTSTWCTYAAGVFTLVSGTGACPATLGDVTGLKWVMTPDLQPQSITAGSRSTVALSFTLQANGNQPGDYYADRFSAFTPTITTAPAPGSPMQLLPSNRVEVATYQFLVGDLVFIDRNNNNKYDAGDMTAPDGTVVELWDAGADGAVDGGDDTLLQTVTTTSGNYLFPELYTGKVYVKLPAANFAVGGKLYGWSADTVAGTEDQNDAVSQDAVAASGGVVVSTVHTLSYTTPGGFPTGSEPLSDNTHSLPLPLGAIDGFTNLTVDLGLSGNASIGDFVWYDADKDGIQDAGETGLSGVPMKATWFGPDGVLGGGDDIVFNTTTDTDGNYLFSNMPYGNYTVETVGVGLNKTFDLDGVSTANSATFPLASGENRTDVDFGYVSTVSLGNLVFSDINRNGVYNPGVDGVVPDGTIVQLFDSAGNLVAITTTVAGAYRFDGLDPGDYFVQIPFSQFATTLNGYTAGANPVTTPNNDVNNDNNGWESVSGAIRTNVIHLTGGYDPVTFQPSGGEPDEAGAANLSLDIGLTPKDLSAIKIVKFTNGQDANTGTGPLLPVGSTVTWTYVVTNTGTSPLANVTVKDDNGTGLTVDDFTLTYAAGYTSGDTDGDHVLDLTETWTFTKTGTATAGQYGNIGTVTGSPADPTGAPIPGLPTVTATDPSHYLGVVPSIEVVKTVQTLYDANTAATAPLVAPGSTVRWMYRVTNTGNVRLINIAVTDNPQGAVVCPYTSLMPGASMMCVLNGTAGTDPYMNTGNVVGTPADNAGVAIDGAANVTDSDDAHYLPVNPAIDIETSVQTSYDADAAGSGPLVDSNGNVRFEFVVVNTGDVDLVNVHVSDSVIGAVSCPKTTLKVGETMTCVVVLPAGTTLTEYTATATVTGTGPATVGPNGETVAGQVVTDADSHHYQAAAPAIQVTKFVQTTYDSNTQPEGPIVGETRPVRFTYIVTNTGNVPLDKVSVEDNILGTITCPDSKLDIGATMTCEATAAATLGDYQNIAKATGVGPDTIDEKGNPVAGVTVSDTDLAHYTGVHPSVVITKTVQTSYDANDLTTAPTVITGSPVKWTYTVHNDGNVALTNVIVTDDQIVDDSTIVCPVSGNNVIGALAAGATVVCTVTGVAIDGTYVNVGYVDGEGPQTIDVDGNPEPGSHVGSKDPAYYIGVNPAIEIKKYVQTSFDADTAASGPLVDPDGQVKFTYIITNIGTAVLTEVEAVDSVETLGCTAKQLKPGESFTCELIVDAVDAGDYANTATVTASSPNSVGPDGHPIPGSGTQVTDSDLGHYSIAEPQLHLETYVQTTFDADTNATAPLVAAGGAVTITYVLTNPGDVPIRKANVTDDTYGTPTYVGGDTNGDGALDPGETWTYTLTTSAPTSGSVTATGTATGIGPDYINTDGKPDGAQEVSATDPHVVKVPDSSLKIVKYVQTLFDANSQADGPTVPTGGAVKFTYVITNTGHTTLTNLLLIDSVEGVIVCPRTDLAPEFSMTCTLTTVAVAGDYENDSVVTGVGPSTIDQNGATVPGALVGAKDPAHYTGVTPSVSIVKAVQETFDANTSGSGPLVAVGADVRFTYTITNTGDTALDTFTLTDSVEGVVPCEIKTLAPGESATCVLTITAQAGGEYSNVGTVSALSSPGVGPDGNPLPPVTVTDSDLAHFTPVAPSVHIETYVQTTFDADSGNGPLVAAGAPVTITYVVTADGGFPIRKVDVQDTIYGTPTYVGGDTNGDGVLDITETWTYTLTTTAPASGTVEAAGTVTGIGPDTIDTKGNTVSGADVKDDDLHHLTVPAQAISVKKYVQTSYDADTQADGPAVATGGAVKFLYEVTNTGETPLTDVLVVDNVEGNVTCPRADLAVGESMTCVLTTVAVAGDYENVAQASGVGPATIDETGASVPGTLVTDKDYAHYSGVTSSIDVKKYVQTNFDAETQASGPTVDPAGQVKFTYIVTNTGTTKLAKIALVDDVEGAIACPATDLAPGESFTCELTVPAIASGDYTNKATVTAVGPATIGANGNEVAAPEVSDTDLGHYTTVVPQVHIETTIQTLDADTAATGADVAAGAPVKVVYTVTNPGTVPVSNVALTDDTLGTPVYVSGDLDGDGLLDPNETWVYELVTAAPASGGIAAVGTVTGNGPDTIGVDGEPVTGAPVTDSDPHHATVAASALTIVKTVQTTFDANTVADGPIVAPGAVVKWTYTVTNTGNTTLTGVKVLDDKILNDATILCDGGIANVIGTLPAGASVVCEAYGTAIASGQYTNTGSVSGTGPATIDVNGEPVPGVKVSASDVANYTPANSSITVVAAVQTLDADDPASGPLVDPNGQVTLTYTVTNNGTTPLTGIVLTDGVQGTIVCPATSLNPGESMVCTLIVDAIDAGQYTAVATVTGTGPATIDADGNTVPAVTVNDTDPVNYTPAVPKVDIEKFVQTTYDADTASDGPFVAAGSPVRFVYIATNTGSVPLTGITVTDDVEGDITCPKTELAAGEQMTCTLDTVAVDTAYTNLGTIIGTGPDTIAADGTSVPGSEVSDADPANYDGIVPSIDIEKSVQTLDADTAEDGPAIAEGDIARFAYLVSNTGNAPVTGIIVSDNVEGEIVCPFTALAVGESMTCTLEVAAVAGDYTNTGTVTGVGPATVDANGDSLPGAEVSDADDAHYHGVRASIVVVKSVNGADANSEPGLTVTAGTVLIFTYQVTNTGTDTITDVAVNDNVEGPVACPSDSLAPGETMTCQLVGDALDHGTYSNIGAVTGVGPSTVDVNGEPVEGETVLDDDPAHAWVPAPSISVTKMVNGLDANTPEDGPTLAAGSTAVFSYIVANTGDVDLVNIAVTDDKGVGVTCGVGGSVIPKLSPGEQVVCSGTQIVIGSAYKNVGTATGTAVVPQLVGQPPVVLAPVVASDVAHYNGADTDGPVTGGNATALVLAGSLVALLGLCLLIAGRRRRPL